MSGSSTTSRDQLMSIARRAMLERGLLPDFSAAVLAETAAIGRPAEADASFRDLRTLLWVSIDNDDSRDLDQLSVAVPMAGGAVKILVAIADVDAIVKRGSAIDGHARANTTSVYTAAEIFSMLPEKLSTDLTSLGENQERLAFVIEMTISVDDGVVAGSDIYRAVVVNKAKLAYNGVSAWLDGISPTLPQMAVGAGAWRAAAYSGSGCAMYEAGQTSARCVEPGNSSGAASIRWRRVSRPASRKEESWHRANRRIYDRRERSDCPVSRGQRFFFTAPGAARA